jgi:hypothetical protein
MDVRVVSRNGISEIRIQASLGTECEENAIQRSSF